MILKVQFLLYILVPAFLNLNAQGYRKLAERGKEFLIFQKDIPNSPTLNNIQNKYLKFHNYHVIKFDSDTIIQGVEYIKVYQIYPQKIYCREFIRETKNNEVYIYTPEKILTKLYDFNLHVGDTINNLVVSMIDTILNSGISRTRYKFNQCCKSGDNATWVVGLGNMKDILLHDYYISCHCDNSTTVAIKSTTSESILIRVKMNDKIIYLDPNYVDFDFKEIDKNLKI